MSQAHVGIVIKALLTDEDLRIRFALERLETIVDLCLRGIDLTSGEIDLLCQTDAHLWFLGDEVRREWRRWADTPDANGPDSPTPDTAQSGEASLAQLMDEIITQIAQRQTRRLYE